MTPAPSLEELIESVGADAASNDPLDGLRQAAKMAASLEQIGDRLLNHFVEESRRGGCSWTQISGALGVTKQAVHKRFSAAVATFERFTPPAKAVLRDASALARRRGGERVEAQDLLLGLLEPSDGVAAVVLRAAKITREECERALALEGMGERAASGERLPFGDSAKDVLKSAGDEAISRRHNYIGTEHLLLGLYSDPDGPAARTLQALGATYADIDEGISRQFAERSKRWAK